MLKELIESGFGTEEDYNCAEKILYGANEAYDLKLSKDALKLSGGFGGGMAIEDKCGALTASIMVLGNIYINNVAHESSRIKELTQKLFTAYNSAMGSIDCAPLKDMHRKEDIGCKNVILKAAEILDDIVQTEGI